MKKKQLKTIEQDENIHVYYVRNDEGALAGCVAIERLPNGFINRGISLCSSKDTWQKRIAKSIAINRLLTARTEKASKPFRKYRGKKANSHMPKLGFKNSFEFEVAPNKKEQKILAIGAKSAKSTKKTTKTTKTAKKTTK
jgi:N-acetylglutamate synthase-like GNAT family acetyltransferase